MLFIFPSVQDRRATQATPNTKSTPAAMNVPEEIVEKTAAYTNAK